ncbi:thioredoxin family protein [Pseudoblastomonas flavescens]|nr:thioredoxin family protein [Alteriqipengyuania flavescens]WJY17479.1 thioredoxin family protein [Alteriqipengyuania flavescens]
MVFADTLLSQDDKATVTFVDRHARPLCGYPRESHGRDAEPCPARKDRARGRVMKRLAATLLLAIAAPLLSVCGPVNSASSAALAHPEATPFDPEANADRDVEDALLQARLNDRLTLAVFGANWCHDSRALAGWLASPRFQQLIEDHYEVVYVDVGVPQDGEGRNLDLAAMAGVTDIEGTPTVIVYASDGKVLNADTAKGWRNAASRSGDEIYAELADYAAR